MREFGECIGTLTRGAMQQTKGLIHSHVHSNVVRIASHSVLKCGKRLLGIVLDMKESKPHAGTENGKIGPVLPSLGPLA